MKLPASWRGLQAEQRHGARAGTRRRAAATRLLAAGLADPLRSARAAGLKYVSQTSTPGIGRHGSPGRFTYRDAAGRPIRDRHTLERIRALVIPPAWADVWICPDPSGHLQATGRDARGRKQYRYHPRWREVRDATKFGALIAFARALPAIRARTDADLRRPGLARERVLAAVVQLLEKTLIRVGNEEYARANGSFGLTTFRDRHAQVGETTIRFVFRGKSGIEHEVALHDRRLARIVRACRDLPGHELFQYVDADGQRRGVGSGDVNAYLREISGRDFTAKDFRTWAGTVLAAGELAATGACATRASARRGVSAAVESVACRLGNTVAVCRKCYIHPAVLDAYVEGETIPIRRAAAPARMRMCLTGDERAVVALLERRLGRADAAS